MAGASADLSLYESVDIVRRAFAGRHGRQLPTAKAAEITAHVSQGRQYLASAEGAGELAKPLLVYYGVLSLTRAAILFLDVQKREASLAASHGLNAHGWSGDLGAGADVRDLRIAIAANGTFRELTSATATEDVEIYTGPFPTTKRLLQHHDEPLDESIVRLGEVLSRLPAVLDLYEQSFDEFAAAREGSIFGLSTQMDLSIFPSTRGLPPDDQVLSAFNLQGPETMHRTEYFARTVPEYLWVRMAEGDRPLPKFVIDRGSIFLVPAFESGHTLPFVAVMFATSYGLGMLARYFPTTWLHILGRRQGDAASPVLRAATDAVREQYPGRILGVLASEHPRPSGK